MRIASSPPRAPDRALPRATRGFRLLWIAAVLVPALALLGAGLATWQEVRREAEERLRRTVEMLHQHALRTVATQETILAAVLRRMDGLGWEEIRQSEELHGFLATLAATTDPLVAGVLVADPEHRIASASYEYPARPVDLSDRGYLRALRAPGVELSVGETVATRPMGWLAFAIARRRPDGGAVISSFRPEPIARFYASVVETPSDIVALFREDGSVLVRHPPLSEPGSAEPNAERTALLARLVRGEAMEATPPVPQAGPPHLFVGRRVGEYPLVVAYGLSMPALEAAWLRRMAAPALGGLAATALLLALTAVAARGAQRQQAMAERRMEAEAQLARAGRAAAIGLLAAGLAHDVKNLVQAVQSGARLMPRRAEDPEEVRRCAALLGDAAERGRRLVDSMLGFARGSAEDGPTPVLDVASSLRDLAALLDRTLGSGWHVRLSLPPGLPPARGDRAGFEAAIVNLAANARDAMPTGGVVTISAWVEELAVAPEEEDGLRPGRYVVAAVADTGGGMDPATLARLGEPFFTTKPPGRGTGLGLATVRGFAARAGGALRFDSTPGRGTTAALWLPLAI